MGEPAQDAVDETCPQLLGLRHLAEERRRKQHPAHHCRFSLAGIATHDRRQLVRVDVQRRLEVAQAVDRLGQRANGFLVGGDVVEVAHPNCPRSTGPGVTAPVL